MIFRHFSAGHLCTKNDILKGRVCLHLAISGKISFVYSTSFKLQLHAGVSLMKSWVEMSEFLTQNDFFACMLMGNVYVDMNYPIKESSSLNRSVEPSQRKIYSRWKSRCGRFPKLFDMHGAIAVFTDMPIFCAHFWSKFGRSRLLRETVGWTFGNSKAILCYLRQSRWT